MVRRFAVLAVFTLAGSSGFRDAVSAHQDVVARAAGQELTVTELAGLIGRSQSVPLRRDVVDRVTDLWVNYQLLGHAIASGDSLLDTATISAANWPQVAQKLADHLHEALVVSKVHVTASQADSAYNAGDVRWIAHILVLVQQGSTPAVDTAKRHQAEALLAQLRHGANFAKLAEQKSNDTVSGRNGGSLGLVLRGQMDHAFEQAAWGLKPGEISDPVRTPYGYHIIYRPRLDEVRDGFTARLGDLFVNRLDSLFLDSLNTHATIKVKGSAPVGVRAVVQNLRDAKESGKVLATWDGGKLTEGEMARWIQAFSPQTIGMIGQAPDSTLALFVKSIARNAMLIHSAQERHIQLTVADRDQITGAYRADLGEMLTRLGVAPESLSADTAVRRNRNDGVARRVQGYFEDIVATSRRHQFFDVQPFLADVLRSRYPWSISPLGVDRALARAKELRGPAAPAAAPGRPPTGATAPALGGPPMSAQPPAQPGKAPTPSRPKSRP